MREFEALTVYGRGGRSGDRGIMMGDLVALEESGATATAEDLLNSNQKSSDGVSLMYAASVSAVKCII